jgi:hypothetical protein
LATGCRSLSPGITRQARSGALSAEVPLTDVARWLGHRNIQVTYRTYSHFVPSAWDTARTALDRGYQQWSAAA